MYTVAIVDDRLEDAQALAKLVERAGTHLAPPRMARESEHPEALSISCFSSPGQLAESLARSFEPDLAFFDIVFDLEATEPSENGIDAVERLLQDHPRTQVVYVSGYDSFHTQVYRTPHAAYLSKPFNQHDVDYAVKLAVTALERTMEEPLCLHARGVDHVVHPADIRYIESRLHMVNVHTVQGDVIEVYSKLSDLLDQLPDRFVRCHQSFAVNLDDVVSLDPGAVVLSNGQTVPVSRRMRSSVRTALFAHLRAKRH